MPGIDGIELIRQMRKLGLDGPVVLMTGDPGAATTRRASDLGAFALLFKPLDHEELVATIERAHRWRPASR